MRAARDSWVNPALALALCAAVGGAFAWLRMPLPWMTGPLLAIAVCNFAGAEMRSPPGARAVGQIVIGTALGLYFTPMVGREVGEHWSVLIAAALRVPSWACMATTTRCGWPSSRLGNQPDM